jgi:hypothetical protein
MAQMPLTTGPMRNTRQQLKDNLCQKMVSNGNRGPSDGSSMSSHVTVTTPPSTLTLSSISTNQGVITQTPGIILPGNPYVRASSLLHRKTVAAIREINTPTNSADDTPMESIKTATPSIGGGGNIIAALKTLLDQGIVEPICQFYSCLVSNEQEHHISKATIEHALAQAAACIAAVVEAERPTNCLTLKGLIQEDVNKTTKELRCRIQSLELKLVASLEKSKSGGGKKKMTKTKGTVTAPTKNSKPTGKKSKSMPTSQKPKSKKKAPTSHKNCNQTSPSGNNNASTAAAKNPKKRKSRIK